ncbi:hypothetical protein SASPL_111172 [Salvia splendens]|uniref:Uncharacterized protein n=1 Tax=Salvia splendens TaxID=180675 RepID=A0A8X8YBX6_SALSN|nr:hypothetical protein SASPL_111172 [Salvia splendens]
MAGRSEPGWKDLGWDYKGGGIRPKGIARANMNTVMKKNPISWMVNHPITSISGRSCTPRWWHHGLGLGDTPDGAEDVFVENT